MTDFYKKVISALKENTHENLIGWEFIQTETNGIQKLYEGHKEKLLVDHQERIVDEISYYLTVYTNFFEEGFMGISFTNVLSFISIKKQIDDAIELSKSSKNKAWKLLEKPDKEYQKVLTFDKEIKESLENIIPGIQKEAVAAIHDLKGIYVNSAEAYVNFRKITRETSTGIKTYKEKSDLYFEIAMEKADSVNNKEAHESIQSVSGKDFKLRDFINECAEQVTSLGNTEEPKTTENAVIVVSEQPIAALLSAIKNQLNSAREYHKFPYLKKGDKVFTGDKNPKSDKLTITLDPFIPEMALSSPYSDEGMVAEKKQIIKEDIVEYRLVNNRYGQYQNIEANGILGNIVVEPGSTSYKDFYTIEEEFLEIIKFSSLLVDSSKLTWSSEIKLAKFRNRDGSTRLIKGGVVSGKINENLNNFVFSKEITKVNSPGTSYDEPMGYIGPKKMLIRNGVSIVGK